MLTIITAVKIEFKFKVTVVKKSIKIHRCVVNTVVVWLYILGLYWCLCVALFGSSNTVVMWLHILGPYW